MIEQDIHGEKPLIITPGNSANIPIGLAVEIPAGHVMMIFSRSGHGFKNSVRLSNATGVIDSDYRGPLAVSLHNDGRARFHVRHGERIAQALVLPIPTVSIEEVETLTDTARGAGGFGSTGK